jgi:regulator of cell morphogenesis and NO signaling
MIQQYDFQTIGAIAAQSPATARLLDRLGIDFCCHGSTPFGEACEKAGQNPQDVAARLAAIPAEQGFEGGGNFAQWPLDLLVDYVLKIHHRGIRRNAPRIIALFGKVGKVHGERHPELFAEEVLFRQCAEALSEHLMKEEQMLFPHIYAQFRVSEAGGEMPRFHCGTVAAPISVMESEHAEEGERMAKIEELSGGFVPPGDACESFRLLYAELKAFRDALHEHIHIENNLIFPTSVALERGGTGR